MTSLAVPPPARAASRDSTRSAETAETTRLFEEHSERILAYCLRRLGSRTEAEDAVQLTFLYAFRALQRGVVPQAERAWLFAIAKNACRWQRRTLSRRGALSSERDLDAFAGPSAHDGDDASELCRDLKEALKAIPASQRRALVLREWHGLSVGEVAARLELSTEATYALLTRARRSFMTAYTARREALPSLQLGMLLYQLKYHAKALVGTAAAKAAVTVAVVGAGIGGAVVVDDLRSSDAAPPSAPVTAVDPPDVGTGPSTVTTRPRSPSTGGTAKGAPGGERSQQRDMKPSTQATATGDRPQTITPTGGPDAPADPAPTPDRPPTGTDVPTTPKAELPPVQVEPPPLPGLDLPDELLPPVEVPPLPVVEELPPLPEPEDLPLPEVPVPELPAPLPKLP